jgi:DNA-binding XRE family transcriptional regulator
MYKVTKEIVDKVKAYLEEHPGLTQEEIGVLCGVSHGTVWNIDHGKYDHLLKEAEAEKIVTEIPYEKLKRLIACENAIDEIFSCAKECFGYDDEIFIDYHSVSSILKKHLPEEHDNKLKEIHG